MVATALLPLPRPIWIDIPINQLLLYLVRSTIIYLSTHVLVQGSITRRSDVIIGKYASSLTFDSRYWIHNPFPYIWPTHNFQYCVVLWLYPPKITTCLGDITRKVIGFERSFKRSVCSNALTNRSCFSIHVCSWFFVFFAVHTAGAGAWRALWRLKASGILWKGTGYRKGRDKGNLYLL